MSDDVRWLQRLQNFQLALETLKSAVELSHQRTLTELEKQGLIQSFEFTHELAWNVLKDYFAYQGNPQIVGSRDASREAFNKGLIANGDVWMEMIKSRNQTSHTYNESTAEEIVGKIIHLYFDAFVSLNQTMISLSRVR